MIKLGSVSLFLSWKCNFNCRHCGFLCSPERTEKMPYDEAIKYIDAAADSPDLKMIAYTGGEPFLYLQEMRELMTYSFNKGFRGGIVTNGFWADDYQKTLSIISVLQEIGLQELITSFDDYHNEYVPAQNVANLIKAAGELNVYSGVNMLVTKKSRIRRANAAEYLGLNIENLVKAKKMWIRESSPLCVGRAKDSYNDEDIINYGEKELLHNPCPFVVRNSVITPEGSLYACCGFGDASEQGPASLMYAGNAREESLEQLFYNVSNNLMFSIIYLFGPYRLLKMAAAEYAGLVFKERYVSNCEVCDEIANNPELRSAIGNVLSKMAHMISIRNGGNKDAKTSSLSG